MHLSGINFCVFHICTPPVPLDWYCLPQLATSFSVCLVADLTNVCIDDITQRSCSHTHTHTHQMTHTYTQQQDSYARTEWQLLI